MFSSNPCNEIDIPFPYHCQWEDTQDEIVDLDPVFHPEYTVVYLAYQSLSEEVWWSQMNSQWVMHEPNWIPQALLDCQFDDSEVMIPKSYTTTLHMLESIFHKKREVSKIPVLFFKDRATLVRFKLHKR